MTNQLHEAKASGILNAFALLIAIVASAVEAPFLLHLAGTSEWQRFAVLGAGFGIVLVSAALLWSRRRVIPPTRACLSGLHTAYLANASLCLIVYSEATGNFSSKSGWWITMVLVWPMLIELVWSFINAFRQQQ